MEVFTLPQNCKEKLDLFAFTPVPTGVKVSTSKSRIGTCLFIVVYLAYIMKVTYTFATANFPRVNQYENRLDDNEVYPAPNMAFAFLTGDNLNISFYDPKYFTFTFQQVTVYSNVSIPRNYTTIPMYACRPDWLNPMFDVLCPNLSTSLQGLLYGSPVNMYPRMKVSICNNATTGNSCANLDDITSKVMLGRLFVFLENYESYDYTTGQPIQDDSNFVSYYYFFVMTQYNRAELKIQAENITLKPDYASTFTTKNLQSLGFENQNFYVSQVPTNISRDVFVWWCSMTDSSLITFVVFDTVLDLLSKIGAMWTLMVSIFAMYFLRFNRVTYYEQRPHMANFDERITPQLLATSGAKQRSNAGDDSSVDADQNSGGNDFSVNIPDPNKSALKENLLAPKPSAHIELSDIKTKGD